MKFLFREKEYEFHSHLSDTYFGNLWKWESKKPKFEGVVVISHNDLEMSVEFSINSLSSNQFTAIYLYLNYGFIRSKHVEIIIQFVEFSSFFIFKTYDYPIQFFRMILEREWYFKYVDHKNLDEEVAERFVDENYLLEITKQYRNVLRSCYLDKTLGNKYKSSRKDDNDQSPLENVCLDELNKISKHLKEEHLKNLENKGISRERLIMTTAKTKRYVSDVDSNLKRVFRIISVSDELERIDEYVNKMKKKRSLLKKYINSIIAKAPNGSTEEKGHLWERFEGILQSLKDTPHIELIETIYSSCVYSESRNVLETFENADFLDEKNMEPLIVTDMFMEAYMGTLKSDKKDDEKSKDELLQYHHATILCKFLFDGNCVLVGNKVLNYILGRNREKGRLHFYFINITKEQAIEKVKRISKCFDKLVRRRNNYIKIGEMIFHFTIAESISKLLLSLPDDIDQVAFDGTKIFSTKAFRYSVENSVLFYDFNRRNPNYEKTFSRNFAKYDFYIYVPEYCYKRDNYLNLFAEELKDHHSSGEDERQEKEKKDSIKTIILQTKEKEMPKIEYKDPLVVAGRKDCNVYISTLNGDLEIKIGNKKYSRFCKEEKSRIDKREIFISSIDVFDYDRIDNSDANLIYLSDNVYSKLKKIDPTLNRSLQFSHEVTYEHSFSEISNNEFENWYCGMRESQEE